MAFAGHVKCCELLLKAGAAVNVQDSSFGDLNTPAHKAASQGHTDILDLLISYGAETSITNKDGKTPHDLLQQYKEQQMLSRQNKLNGPGAAPIKETHHIPWQETSNDISVMSTCPLCLKPCLVFVENKVSKQLVCKDCKYCE
ncbi:ankyrin repeat domain-containing protein [archaeon]|nr:MAG: ankyrin repeat domain-containing protein [archaeon]